MKSFINNKEIKNKEEQKINLDSIRYIINREDIDESLINSFSVSIFEGTVIVTKKTTIFMKDGEVKIYTENTHPHYLYTSWGGI